MPSAASRAPTCAAASSMSGAAVGSGVGRAAAAASGAPFPPASASSGRNAAKRAASAAGAAEPASTAALTAALAAPTAGSAAGMAASGGGGVVASEGLLGFSSRPPGPLPVAAASAPDGRGRPAAAATAASIAPAAAAAATAAGGRSTAAPPSATSSTVNAAGRSHARAASSAGSAAGAATACPSKNATYASRLACTRARSWPPCCAASALCSASLRARTLPGALPAATSDQAHAARRAGEVAGRGTARTYCAAGTPRSVLSLQKQPRRPHSLPRRPAGCMRGRGCMAVSGGRRAGGRARRSRRAAARAPAEAAVLRVGAATYEPAGRACAAPVGARGGRGGAPRGLRGGRQPCGQQRGAAALGRGRLPAAPGARVQRRRLPEVRRVDIQEQPAPVQLWQLGQIPWMPSAPAAKAPLFGVCNGPQGSGTLGQVSSLRVGGQQHRKQGRRRRVWR